MQDGRRDRDTVKGGRSSRGRTDEKLVLGPEWIKTSFADLRVGDMVVAVVMRPFDDGQGGEKLLFTGVKTIPLRKGMAFEGLVVDDDWRGTPGNLFIERTGFPTRIDHRLIPPPVLASFGQKDLEGRGTRLYRHRDLGPDRSTDDGFWLINRLREEAGGDDTDPVAIERLAACLAPPTTVGAEPAPLGMYHARLMLEGDHPYSESVYRQIVAQNAKRPAIPAPTIAVTVAEPPASKPIKKKPSSVIRLDDETMERRRRLGPYAGADAVLSLRFETRAIWGVLKTVLGVDETACAIALDLYAEALTTGRWTSYSRTKRHYARLAGGREKWQARDALYTADRILPAVNDLEAGGWIEHARALPGSLGWQSRMRATPALIDAIRGLVRSNRLTMTAYQPSSALVLRNAEGEQIQFRETDETKRMERNVERLNEGFRAIRVEGAFPSCVMRICNESLERGGRFYLEGGSVQVMPEEERLRVTWNGERSGEVDYKTMHPCMLYSDAGVVPPKDCYGIDGYPRDLVKVAVMAVINAPTYGSAMGAIAHNDHMADVEVPGSKAAFAVAARLMEDLKKLHRPISSSFHSGAGAFLMRREADILEDVMLTMRKKGEVVLPIHDSGLCRLGAVPTLEEVMVEAAEKAGLKQVRIETTRAANDGRDEVFRAAGF